MSTRIPVARRGVSEQLAEEQVRLEEQAEALEHVGLVGPAATAAHSQQHATRAGAGAHAPDGGSALARGRTHLLARTVHAFHTHTHTHTLTRTVSSAIVLRIQVCEDVTVARAQHHSLTHSRISIIHQTRLDSHSPLAVHCTIVRAASSVRGARVPRVSNARMYC